MRSRLLALSALVLACPPAAPSTSTEGPEPATSTASGSGSTEGSTGTSLVPTTSTGNLPVTTTNTPDLGGPCPVGADGCPCTAGGACDPGLTCQDEICTGECLVGALGCSCTAGGGCDPGLTCEAGACGQAVSPPCDPILNDDDCCGDFVVDTPLEECDLAQYNKPNDVCTPECKIATCGDGYVLDPDEACDGGEHCTAECTFSTCGDGVVDPWEWCEKTRADDPECSDLCTDARKIVFITSTHYQGGALGGLAGADEKCQTHAEAGGLSGSFRAWLGLTEEDAPANAWPWVHRPYVNVDGAFLFMPPDVPCGSLPLTLLDEEGEQHPGCAADFNGTSLWVWFMTDGGSTCGAWDDVAEVGSAAEFTGCSLGPVPCSEAAPLVCVEQ